MTLFVKRLRAGATLPARATEGSAGYDLSALLEGEATLAPGEIRLIPTGIAIALPQGHAGMVYARSSLASKHGITLANSVGVVDCDYRGELMVPLINLGGKPYTITPGERIAQLVVTPVALPEVREVQTLDETERGAGGFGSTGKQ